MKIAAVIPARLGARRFPRKVLARQTGKYLLQHVYERVKDCETVDRVLVATDSAEVAEACQSFGAEAVMTSDQHVSGTDRVAEVAARLDHDLVINVQGDEPLIEHDDLAMLAQLFQGRDGEGVVMSTLAAERTDLAGFVDPNIVKVVIAENGNALYFSRSPLPYGEPAGGEDAPVEWLQHIGIYAYRREFLLRLAQLPPTRLEKRERLEQLRVLDHGYKLRVGLTHHEHLGVDTPQEYKQFVERYRLRGQSSKE